MALLVVLGFNTWKLDVIATHITPRSNYSYCHIYILHGNGWNHKFFDLSQCPLRIRSLMWAQNYWCWKKNNPITAWVVCHVLRSTCSSPMFRISYGHWGPCEPILCPITSWIHMIMPLFLLTIKICTTKVHLFSYYYQWLLIDLLICLFLDLSNVFFCF